MPQLTEEERSFMAAWERGSPMRSFIYYLQRATCGALAYLVLHQLVLGLRLVGMTGATQNFFEGLLYALGTPGRYLCERFFDPVRPLHLPLPLSTFFMNIVFYFFTVWLLCYLGNTLFRRSFVGPKGDPFVLKPQDKV